MELLRRLCQAFGPSGNEGKIREIIKNEVKPYADEITQDTLGNLIVRKKGTGKKIMLSAHMDEVGIIVTVIDDKNYIHFSNIGGVKPETLHSSKVEFENGAVGVVYKKVEKPSKLADFYIDSFDACKGDKPYSVKVGDVGVMRGAFDVFGDFISSKALDDRVGCYILIETLKQISGSENDLYFVFSVQEELGLRGAKTAAAGISPDYAIAVDVTTCDDFPGGGKYPLKLGEGPAIKIKDNSIMCHPIIKKHLSDVAQKHNIKVQYEVLDVGGTDAGAIHTSGAGVATGAISIPTRYIHTPCETVSISDVKGAINLLTKACMEVL
ncbi:MAG: M42 family metallopeptidase [Eubacteriales bacterium]|nr:M42 family metallopeptidase [Eubacteriales bacterium]